MDEEYYPRTVDHSQDVQIRTDKNGKMFGIKNIRQEFSGLKMTLIADITGDEEAAKNYLDSLGRGLMKGIYTKE